MKSVIVGGWAAHLILTTFLLDQKDPSINRDVGGLAGCCSIEWKIIAELCVHEALALRVNEGQGG